MSIFDQFETEKVTLRKKNGTRYDEFDAIVQKDQIISQDVALPVEEGDIIIRSLPSGLKEKYKILDRGYQEKFGSIPAFYEMDVKKITELDDEDLSGSSKKVIYNLHGNNSRVNINSSDSSINIVDKSTKEFFVDLRKTVKDEISSPDKEELLQKISELENAEGSNSFSKKYAEFMAIAANHTTVLAPYFPALVQFLTQ